MRYFIVLAVLFLSYTSHADIQKTVFVSFSMPEQLLASVFEQASDLDIPVVLNGLVEDDFRKTLQKIFMLSKAHPNLSIQIDPIAFETYQITNVPALVVDNGSKHDVLYGNLALSDGLNYLKDRGDVL